MFSSYLLNENRRKYFDEKIDFCIFCNPRDPFLESTLIYDDSICVAIANKYPYGSGHILIAPKEHIRHMDELSNISEFFKRLTYFYKAIKSIYNPEGMNVGLSSGKAAGASIDHLHFHILPRWYGDVGFLEIVSDTKVLVESPTTVKNKLKGYLDNNPPNFDG